MILNNLFFWAFFSMFGLSAAGAVVGSHPVGQKTWLGFLIVAVFFLGRFILPLPFVMQPRLKTVECMKIIGILLFLIGAWLSLEPCFSIRPFNIAGEKTQLMTNGFYR
ncbi:hypothetical protein JW835_00545 [bacterium]|nr:hypothetical protein [bacterium]